MEVGANLVRLTSTNGMALRAPRLEKASALSSVTYVVKEPARQP